LESLCDLPATPSASMDVPPNISALPPVIRLCLSVRRGAAVRVAVCRVGALLVCVSVLSQHQLPPTKDCRRSLSHHRSQNVVHLAPIARLTHQLPTLLFPLTHRIGLLSTAPVWSFPPSITCLLHNW